MQARYGGGEVPDYAYFCWRWAQQKPELHQAWDPIEDGRFRNDVLNEFLEKEDMYNIRVESKYRRSSFCRVECHLWDVYGAVPSRLAQMWRWADSSRAFISSEAGCRCFNDFDTAIITRCKAAETAYEYYRAEYKQGLRLTDGQSQKLEELDLSLTSFNERLWKDTRSWFGDSSETPEWIDEGSSRFEKSLNSFLAVTYNKTLSDTVKNARQMLQLSSGRDYSFLTIKGNQQTLSGQPENNVQTGQLPTVLFAVAGSGKTQAIFNYFYRTYGHYLVSGRSLSNNQDSILSPRQEGASADTKWIYDLSEHLRFKLGDSERENRQRILNMVLLANRQDFLDEWRSQEPEIAKEQHGTLDLGPASWLLMQTVCTTKYDPFKDMLRMRILLDPAVWVMKVVPITPIPVIIDEAQYELDTFSDGKPFLRYFLYVLHQTSNIWTLASIAGTSLRLDDCEDYVKMAMASEVLDRIRKVYATCVSLSGFLTNPNSLRKQFAEHIMPMGLLDNYCRASRDWPEKLWSRREKLAEVLSNLYLEWYRPYERSYEESSSESGIWDDNLLALLITLSMKSSRPIKLSEMINSIRPVFAQSNTTDDILKPFHLAKFGEFLLCTDPPLISEEISSSAGSTSDQANMKFLKEIFTSYNVYLFGQHNISRGEFVPLDSSSLRKTLEPYDIPQLAEQKHSVQIRSHEDFRQLLNTHLERLMEKIGYFYTLGEETERRRLWEIAYPSTGIFQNEGFKDAREELYSKAVDFLKRHLDVGGPVTPTTVQLKMASQKAANAFIKECDLLRYSVWFRGRIRWSTYYIEHLLVSYLKIPDLGQTSIDLKWIEYHAREAALYIKSCLKGRIEDLKKGRHFLILKNLYFTAIRADLMHKPSIFPSDRSARMITEGFALLDPAEPGREQRRDSPVSMSEPVYGHRQKLSERIVVDAVIEYLKERERQDEDNIENVLQNFLFDAQDDASGFGKAAEFYFAWCLGGMFSQHSFSSDPASESQKQFRQVISRAHFISYHSSNTTSVLQGIDRYTLEEPPPELGSDLSLGSEITFADWVQRVHDGKFFPTFYFPNILAGPDIVFYLKAKSGERILCAFQVKTGEKCDKADAFKLIRTLDPKLWFWGSPHHRKELDDALYCQEWQNDRILTALIITSRSSKEFFATTSDFYTGMQTLQPYCRKVEPYQQEYHKNVYRSNSEKTKVMTELLVATRRIYKAPKKRGDENSEDHRATVLRGGEESCSGLNGMDRRFISNENQLVIAYTDTRSSKNCEVSTEDIDEGMRSGNKCSVTKAEGDRVRMGYYFVVIDSAALGPITGPTFLGLCKAMKKVEKAKSKERS